MNNTITNLITFETVDFFEAYLERIKDLDGKIYKNDNKKIYLDFKTTNLNKLIDHSFANPVFENEFQNLILIIKEAFEKNITNFSFEVFLED